jgi:hypothetical protein
LFLVGLNYNGFYNNRLGFWGGGGLTRRPSPLLEQPLRCQYTRVYSNELFWFSAVVAA